MRFERTLESGALARLLELQELDSELDTLSAKVETIPSRIEEVNRVASDERVQLDELRAEIGRQKKRYKLDEIDIKELEEKIGGRSAQAFGAKTNEQYKAFLKEIETLNAQKSRLEDEMITIMEFLESANEKVDILERELAKVETEVRERIQQLENERQQLEAAISDRRAARLRVLSCLDELLVNTYERIRESKHGLAVVHINGNRCGGCLIPLPPQQILEVGKLDRLHFCEHCGRILVPDREGLERQVRPRSGLSSES